MYDKPGQRNLKSLDFWATNTNKNNKFSLNVIIKFYLYKMDANAGVDHHSKTDNNFYWEFLQF